LKLIKNNISTGVLLYSDMETFYSDMHKNNANEGIIEKRLKDAVERMNWITTRFLGIV
jgi:hypothetical protein